MGLKGDRNESGVAKLWFYVSMLTKVASTLKELCMEPSLLQLYLPK